MLEQKMGKRYLKADGNKCFSFNERDFVKVFWGKWKVNKL